MEGRRSHPLSRANPTAARDRSWTHHSSQARSQSRTLYHDRMLKSSTTHRPTTTTPLKDRHHDVGAKTNTPLVLSAHLCVFLTGQHQVTLSQCKQQIESTRPSRRALALEHGKCFLATIMPANSVRPASTGFLLIVNMVTLMTELCMKL